jgi:hypothetical protein
MIRYFNLVLFAVMILMNYLANSLPLNNVTTGELSDSYPNLFVPAGLTFSIWGIIYILLATICVVQFTGGSREPMMAIGWFFALTCIFNSLWIVCWHYRLIELSLVIMMLLLVTLIFINMQIKGLPFGIIKAAFGIYIGWICIATIANITALFVDYSWSGFGISEVTWTIIMIVTGLIITSLAVIRFNNPFIGLAVIWAFIGIAIKRQADFRSIFITALAAMAVAAIVTALVFLKKLKFK